MDVRLLNGLAAVEQHIGARGLHGLVLHLSDRRVVEMVPGPGDGTEAQSRVVTHVQVPRVILEKAPRRWFIYPHVSWWFWDGSEHTCVLLC